MSRSHVMRPALAGFAGLAGVAIAMPGAADGQQTAVQCGDVVRGTAQLEQDLTCSTDPALTVLGVLDLNTHTLTCAGGGAEQEGVVLEGRGAILHNGSVRACFRSVVLRGRGGHLVTGVTADGTDRGFSVESRANRVVGNRASSRDNDAFRVEGQRNLLSGNTVTAAGADGFGVRGPRNVLADNEVTGVGEEGFDVRERSNEVLANVVSDSAGDGIQVRTGGNRIVNNEISRSKGRGILIGGLLGEPARSNDVIGNDVTDGEQEGINVDLGFVRQRILHNTAKDNQLEDLRDQNPDCDDNLWSGNSFGTADPADCIE